MNKVDRLKKSRARWKEKASARAEEIRERRKEREEIKDQNPRTKSRIKAIKEFIPLRKIPDDLDKKQPDYGAEGSIRNQSVIGVDHCVDHDSLSSCSEDTQDSALGRLDSPFYLGTQLDNGSGAGIIEASRKSGLSLDCHN